MTGLTEVDNPPSIESSEGVDDPDLRFPLSLKDYIESILYIDKTDWFKRKIALIAIKDGAVFKKTFCFLVKLIIVLVIVYVGGVFLYYEFNIGGFIRRKLGSVGYNSLSTVTKMIWLIITAFIFVPVFPKTPKSIETLWRVNAQTILMVRRNPKWINANLLPVWKNLVEGRAYPDKATLEKTYEEMSTSDDTKLDSQVWTSFNPIAVKFLEKWISETEDAKIRTERALMILWAFNPPGRDDNSWGEKFDDMITFAQTKFALEIYSLLSGLSDGGGAIYNEFIQQAEENEKSFEWLKEQMVNNDRHEPPCVTLLDLWNQHHYSKD